MDSPIFTELIAIRTASSNFYLLENSGRCSLLKQVCANSLPSYCPRTIFRLVPLKPSAEILGKPVQCWMRYIRSLADNPSKHSQNQAITSLFCRFLPTDTYFLRSSTEILSQPSAISRNSSAVILRMNSGLATRLKPAMKALNCCCTPLTMIS